MPVRVFWTVFLCAVVLLALSQYSGASRVVSAPVCRDMVYDDASGILHLTSGDSILRYSTQTHSFLSPFSVGGDLLGIDLSPDGSTLAVADRTYVPENVFIHQEGSAWIHLVDTRTGGSTKIPFVIVYDEAGTRSVAFGSDGNVLFTSDYAGSGWLPLRKLDCGSKEIVELTGVIHRLSNPAMLCASADRSVIAWEEGDASAGPLGRYRVADGNIVRVAYHPWIGSEWFTYSIGVNRNGNQCAVNRLDDVVICDRDMALTGQVIGVANDNTCFNDVAYSPVADVLYASVYNTSKVRAYETNTFCLVGNYDVGTNLSGPEPNVIGSLYGTGRLKTSHDGRWVFVLTPNGFSSFRPGNNPPTAYPQSVTTKVGTPVNIDLTGSDPDGEPFEYVAGWPGWGCLTGTAPHLVYTPGPGFYGTDSFAYRVNDNDLDSAPATVTINVAEVPPVTNISGPSAITTKSGPVSYTVWYTDAYSVSLSPADITLNRTGTARGAVSVSGSGYSYRTVTISNITGSGTLGISVAAGSATNPAGPATAAGPSQTFAVVTTKPAISISAPSVAATSTGPVSYTVTYKDASSVVLWPNSIKLNWRGTANGSISVTGDGPTTRTVTISGITGDGSLGISIGQGTASNQIGLAPSASSAMFDVVNTAPLIKVSGPSKQATISGPVSYSVSYLNATGISLSPAQVHLFRTGDADGTISASGSGLKNRTITISNITGDGTLCIELDEGTAWNIGGLTPLVYGSNAFSVTNSRPAIEIGAPSTYSTVNGPASFAVTYTSAASVSLSSGKIHLLKTGTANGRISVTGKGVVRRTVTISGITGTGTLSISIDAGTARNLAGSAPAAGPSGNVVVDSGS